MMSTLPKLRGVLVYGNTLAAVVVAATTVAVLIEANVSISEATPLNSNAVFVSSSGSAEAPGTRSSPTTLASAINRIRSGGTIYLRGGTYPFSRTVTIAPGNNGTPGARKTLSAYPGETPVLDFSAMTEEPTNRGLAVNGSFWHISGVVVEHAGDNGIFIGGSNNVIERAVTRFNHDSGLQISRISPGTARSQWPSSNLVASMESYDNADSDGEDADGFAAKLTVGPGNIFRHDVSHNNIGDGWDLSTMTRTGSIAPVTIEDSLSFDNGTLSNGTRNTNGDRNGYNLGGSGVTVDHIIRRSIAYRNGKHGFTDNMNPGSIAMTGNISMDNRQRNYSFEQGTHTFRGNTSCRSVHGPDDTIAGSTDRSNLFWSRSTRHQCASVTGRLTWSFDSSGRLAVAFGDKSASTLSPTASVPTAPAASGTLLTVDFEDGDTSDWAMTGGSWAVRSDETHVLTQSTVSGSARALAGSSGWTDQNVRARVALTDHVRAAPCAGTSTDGRSSAPPTGPSPAGRPVWAPSTPQPTSTTSWCPPCDSRQRAHPPPRGGRSAPTRSILV